MQPRRNPFFGSGGVSPCLQLENSYKALLYTKGIYNMNIVLLENPEPSRKFDVSFKSSKVYLNLITAIWKSPREISLDVSATRLPSQGHPEGHKGLKLPIAMA